MDLRTDEEHDHLLFPFALHIPIHELPDRIDKVLHDKFVITLLFAEHTRYSLS